MNESFFTSANRESIPLPRGCPVANHPSGNGFVRAVSGTNLCIGLLAQDVGVNSTGSIQLDGDFEMTDWTVITGTSKLLPDTVYYASASGKLTSVAPATPQIVGTSLSPTSLKIEIEPVASAPGITGVQLSAGTVGTNRSDFTFSNSNGVSFGLGTGASAGIVTATVATNYQSFGAYLTTAALSADSSKYAGTNGAITGGSITVNTSGVSVNLPAYLTTAGLSQDSSKYAGTSTGMTGGSVTLNTSGIAISLPAYLTTAMASNAATISNVNVSAGTTSNNLSALTFSNSNGVSFGLDGSTVTATVATNYQSQGAYLTTAMLSNAATISNVRFSAGTLSNNLSAITFSDSNGVSFGLNTNSVVTATVATNYQSQGAYLTTAALSQDSSKYAGTSTGITGGSITLNTSGIAINLPAYLTTAALSADSSKYAGTSTGMTGGSVTLNTSGIAINLPAYLTTAALSADSSKYAGTSTGITGGSVTLNTSGIAINLPAYLTTAALSADSSKYAGTSTGITGGSVTLNTSGIAINLPAYLTTAALSAQTSNFAGTSTSVLTIAGSDISVTLNTTGLTVGYPKWLTTAQAPGAYLTTAALSADSSKYAGTSTGITGGSVTLNTSGIAINLPAYLTTAALSGDTSKYAGITTGTQTTAGVNLLITNNTYGINFGVPAWLTTADLSQNSSKYAGTVSGATNCNVTVNTSGVSVSLPFISSYENIAFAGLNNVPIGAGSTSAGVAFNLPQPISASFLRVLCVMGTNSTTLSTAAASMNGSAQVFSTINAVIYSIGVGASSQSLQYVASGSTGWTILNSISLGADGTSGFYTQGITGYGDGANVSQSTANTVANTNYSFTTGWLSNFTSFRCLDVPFANSLSAGPYWLLFGFSSSSNSNSARCSNATNCMASINSIYGQSGGGAGQSFGIMGSTNLTSVHYGVGSFSTLGGGTTNSLPISAISTINSYARLYFQLLRSA